MIRSLLLLFACWSLGFSAQAQTTLSEGDLVFTGHRSTFPDNFSFLFLTDIEANTVIFFTDNGWRAGGGFRLGEGTLIITFTEVVTCGTEITVMVNSSNPIVSGATTTTDGTNPSLSIAGDQVFAYQGDATSPTLIAAIHTNGDWDANAMDSNTSAQPPGLTNFVIFTPPVLDNAVYDCSTTSGTMAELRAAINNGANWNTDDDPANLNFPSSCSFEVTECGGSTPKTTYAPTPSISLVIKR
ncbi:MAG: hypothetical protein AAF798_08440 [Bacteroidota bacterium]